MRDLVLVIFVLGCLGVSLRYPFAGLITWAWFTILTPHQMAYGTFGIPLNLLIAGVTIFAVIYSREAQKFRFEPITILLLLFLGWQTVAQQMSLLPENSGEFYSRFTKTIIFILLCAQMATTKLRFHAMIWIMAGGFGLYAAKGALFTLVTLGQYRVHGLANTILEDNNHFGIAIATMLPIMVYLYRQLSQPLMRYGMLGVIFLSVLAVIGTHSRGALVALLVFAGFYWWRSRHKVGLSVLGLVLAIPAIRFMPEKWIERMKTIGEASEDASFQGRVDAWIINYRLAQDHPYTGVGLRNSYIEDIAAISDPERAPFARAAHSIYFEILGGSGFVGLAIFLALIGCAFFQAYRITKSKSPSVTLWQRDYAHYSIIALTIFCVGGASTSMEMWDGYLILIALIAALSRQALIVKVDRRGFAFRRKKMIRARKTRTYADVF